MNSILRQGVVTPYVLFTFPSGFTVENFSNNFGNVNDINCAPRFFINLHHNRTCSQACSFKLDIVYVPDTFSKGNLYLIDSEIVQSVGEQIVYKYGYFDYWGRRHEQLAEYTGQIYTYSSDVDVMSGTINYSLEGCAVASDLNNSMAKIEATNEARQPSEYLETLIKESTYGGFYDLQKYYNISIEDRNDEKVIIPNFDSAPVLDLIMGAVTGEKNNGLPVRKGGLVELSLGPEITGTENISRLLTEEEYNIIHGQTASGYTMWGEQAKRYQEQYASIRAAAQAKLKSPFVCYIDDNFTTNGKFGTLRYKCKDRTSNLSANDECYIYRLGNDNTGDFADQDVLSFSVTYDGAVAMAAGGKTCNTSVGIDAAGNNHGTTYDTQDVESTGKSVDDTKSGTHRNLITSVKEMTDIMIYPFEASMTVVGQINPSHLLDIIYVTILVNGVEHQVLSGEYMILEITDEISSSGFTTTLRLIRQNLSNIKTPTETISGTGDGGPSGEVASAILSTTPQPTVGSTQSLNQNRT